MVRKIENIQWAAVVWTRMGRLVRDDRKATVTQITTCYNQGMQNTISECTILWTLKQMGYSSIRPHLVLLLSAKNRKRRQQFAQAHQNWTIEDWKKVAWSDESQFHQRDSANPSFHLNFTFQLGSLTIAPSKTARNLGVVIDDKLNFTDHITKTARSCRFALYNIKKIRPFLSEHATQLLVQALVLSRLDYCNALLAGLPANSIKPLQLIQNAAARLIFNEPKRTHVTPLFINLHWLPIAARIKFKALMFAYRTTSGSAPLYLNSLLQTYMPSRSLRSASERRITVPR